MGAHTRFDGATAVVTGAGSGIGAALARELVRRGATVTVTDVDGEAAAAVATEIGAEAARLDVTDASAVEDLVARVADGGGLDLLFNNAGVSFGGRTEAMTLGHWRRMIEVDLMGVVHGVAAAWPRMVAQGAGHIVNTASAAGLVASPFVAAYAAAKHGVVGLSHSLRLEGAPAGVRVSVLCPGMVDTPILDGGAPADLPAMAGGSTMTGRRYLALAGMRPISAEVLASRALDGVARNRATIVVPSVARAGWVLARLSPGLFERVGASRRSGSSPPSTTIDRRRDRVAPPAGFEPATHGLGTGSGVCGQAHLAQRAWSGAPPSATSSVLRSESGCRDGQLDGQCHVRHRRREDDRGTSSRPGTVGVCCATRTWAPPSHLVVGTGG